MKGVNPWAVLALSGASGALGWCLCELKWLAKRDREESGRAREHADD